ncbi:hypothetical protein DYB25_004165 [Aphanomyces astaci]|uniref:FHA domain-containing protein n=2 Tax=Aphanomyces astaci TaxID=112090 RepID=A0A396ZRS6_APHAT|nr:hypothetical protein DYB25_004165 [Aphanomyces astaci]RHY52203.1 hypothetical protein DYB34_004978 [Aphanomyces astaci]
MEKEHVPAFDFTDDDDSIQPLPKRPNPHDDGVLPSPMALIPISVNPDVTKEVECQSPPTQDTYYDDDHDEELSQMRRYYEDDKNGSMRLKLHASTKECMTHYDLTSLDEEDLVNIELGPQDRSIRFGREDFVGCLQSTAITSLGLHCLSAHHCTVEWSEVDDASLYVTDLSSTNGTIVNSTPLDHVNDAGMAMVHAAPPIDVSVSFATMDALRTMVSSKCRVLHYSGHGATNCLYFESDEQQGMADLIPVDTLLQIVRTHVQLHLRLVGVEKFTLLPTHQPHNEVVFPHMVVPRSLHTPFEARFPKIWNVSLPTLCPDLRQTRVHARRIPSVCGSTYATVCDRVQWTNVVTFACRMHKLTRHIHGAPMLVVLDGCDTVLLGDAQMFTTFVNSQLADNIGLKVLTTSVYFCQTDRVHDHGLYVFKTPPMTRKASAKLLVDMVFPRKLPLQGMTRSPLYAVHMADTMDNVYAVLAAHPVIQSLRGIPRAICRCANILLAQESPLSVDALLHLGEMHTPTN